MKKGHNMQQQPLSVSEHVNTMHNVDGVPNVSSHKIAGELGIPD
jgi:hypothetical protein